MMDDGIMNIMKIMNCKFVDCREQKWLWLWRNCVAGNGLEGHFAFSIWHLGMRLAVRKDGWVAR